MTTCADLLAAILDRPEDDLPRMAFADLCEEQGDDERAKFIRASLEYASGESQERQRLAERMAAAYVRSDLTAAGVQQWVDYRTGGIWMWWRDTAEATDYGSEHRPMLYLWRGFIREIAFPQEQFLRHAESLFNSHPIERVRLTDRGTADWISSSGHTQMHSWQCVPSLSEGISHIRDPIWDHLSREEARTGFRRYPSQGEANTDLENAALKYGRSLRKKRTT